jgi:hypothetical protein
MTMQDETPKPAGGTPVERPVGRLEPERARPCELGCNGCDYCTDYEDDDDPWNDGITPCEHCDGEGYEWWK